MIFQSQKKISSKFLSLFVHNDLSSKPEQFPGEFKLRQNCGNKFENCCWQVEKFSRVRSAAYWRQIIIRRYYLFIRAQPISVSKRMNKQEALWTCKCVWEWKWVRAWAWVGKYVWEKERERFACYRSSEPLHMNQTGMFREAIEVDKTGQQSRRRRRQQHQTRVTDIQATSVVLSAPRGVARACSCSCSCSVADLRAWAYITHIRLLCTQICSTWEIG